MTTISRRNILELIGNHRGKYHSCILTCYNFDFSFFEEQVLTKLRAANIKNINVFADGHFLEQAQEFTTGREFYFNKTYNFLPVYEKGVFHPKILFLTGLKHGLLIIGSGNITSSGLSTNDEIWGAFHLDNPDNENSPIFGAVWDYLQKYTSINYGFLKQKIDWIMKYSPWLESLPSANDFVQLQSLNQSVCLVTNTESQSIYQQILEFIPKDNLQAITIISPYFDKSGQFLQQLFNDYQPQQMNCVVDTTSGILPKDLDLNYQHSISFFDWSECVDNYNEIVNRLHAKIILFKYTDGKEYMVLGSANASMAAMGGLSQLADNAEAGLIVMQNQQFDWLNELEIKLPKNKININSFKGDNGLSPSSIIRNSYKNRIIYTELKGLDLTCYLKDPSVDDVWMVNLGRSGEILEKIVAKSVDNRIICQLSESEYAFKVYIENSDSERCSNYCIIHRYEALLRCNPDPTHEKLDSLLEGEFPEDEGFTTLLEYVDYDWADDEANNIDTINPKNFKPSVKTEHKTQENEYQRLTSEEFNKISMDVLAHQSGLLTNSNIKIADFLNIVISGESQRTSDFSESDEQKLLEDEEQKGEGEEIKSRGVKKVNAKQEKKAIIRYFKKLETIYTNKLDSFFETRALTKTPNELITIKSLSKILIAVQILSIYQGKKFSQLQDCNGSALLEEYYIKFGIVTSSVDTVKGFLISVLGKFFLLATGGFKKYDYEILNQKVKTYRLQLFEKTLFICLNTDWRNEDEKKYLQLLLLNLHYFVLPVDAIDEAYFSQLKSKTVLFRKNAKYVSALFSENLSDYENILLPKFKKWYKVFSNEGERKQYLIKETHLLLPETIIFSSRIGFNNIKKVTRGDIPELDLSREGYPNLENKHILLNVSYGQKCIVFP